MDPKESARLAAIIKTKLAEGKLPYNSIPRVWGGADGRRLQRCSLAGRWTRWCE